MLKGVDITIPDGSIFGLVGVSGAGKSTLLRCINGLESYDGGSIVVDGVDVGALSRSELRKFRGGIGMIFQHFSLLERKSVRENVAFPMECFGIGREQRDERVRELLSLVGLSDKIDVLPRELSGGQKQRVAIARALTMNPKVLLCDEATSALDPNITRSILALLKRINRELGITIVVVTHQMSVVKEVCDSVAILEHGSLAYAGDVQDLFFNHPDAIARVIGPTGSLEESEHEALFEVVQREGDESLLSRLAIDTGVAFRIVWGGLDRYKDVIAGSYRIGVPESAADKVQAFLEGEQGIEWRRVEDAGEKPADAGEGAAAGRAETAKEGE